MGAMERANNESWHSNDLLRYIVDRTSDAITVIGGGHILYLNGKMRQRFPSLNDNDKTEQLQGLLKTENKSILAAITEAAVSLSPIVTTAYAKEEFIELEVSGFENGLSIILLRTKVEFEQPNKKRRLTIESRDSLTATPEISQIYNKFSQEMSCIICIDGKKSNIVHANASFLEWVHSSAEDIIGKAIQDVLSMGTQWDQVSKQLDQMTIGSRRTDECQVKLSHSPDFRLAEISSVYIGPSPDKKKMYMQTMEDVQKKRTGLEQQILEKEEAANQMLDRLGILANFLDERSPVMMGTLEVNQEEESMHFVTFNQAAAEYFKSSGSISLDPPATKVWMSNLSRSQQLHGPVTFEVENDDKTLCCCGVHVSGNRFSIIAQDITQRKEVELRLLKLSEELENEIRSRTKQLEGALDVKSRFLATMSHEMRTPLFGVMGTLNVLNELKLDPQYQEMIRVGQICGEQLLVLINDILDFSRLQENKMEIENYPFSVQQAIQDSLEVVAVEAHKKGLDLIYDIFNRIPLQINDEHRDPNPPPLTDEWTPDSVVGDAARVRQVLVNLLSNSIKFSEKGQVIVRCKIVPKSSGSKMQTVEFSVEDSGIGISGDAKVHLFQPFYQVDDSATRKYGGTGLGLPISKKLCELMGGQLKYVTVEGRGTLFTFTLASVDVHKFDIPRPAFLKMARKGRVIVSDASVPSCRAIRNMLEWWGFEVVELPTRDEVLQCLLSLGEAMSSEPNTPTYKLLIIDYKNLTLETSSRESTMASSILNATALASTTRLTMSAFHRSCPSFARQKLATEDIMMSVANHIGIQTLILSTPRVTVPDGYKTIKKPLKMRSMYKMVCYVLGMTSTEILRMGSKETLVIRPKSPSFTPLRILVAEDNPLNQKVIRRLLSSMGFRDCEIVSNGQLALEAVTRGRYDVILMDVMMPIMGGIESTERIRALPHEQPIIIGLTADACDENEEKCRGAGMDDFLTKPVQQAKLQKILQDCALSVVHKHNAKEDVTNPVKNNRPHLM